MTHSLSAALSLTLLLMGCAPPTTAPSLAEEDPQVAEADAPSDDTPNDNDLTADDLTADTGWDTGGDTGWDGTPAASGSLLGELLRRARPGGDGLHRAHHLGERHQRRRHLGRSLLLGV